MNREMKFNPTVKRIESRIEVPNGNAKVKLSPSILISPGKFPNEIPKRLAKYSKPPSRNIPAPTSINVFATWNINNYSNRGGSFLSYGSPKCS
jgi:hypothetical protein